MGNSDVRYCGVSIAIKGWKEAGVDIPSFAYKCWSVRKKLHLFAGVSSKLLKEAPAYSADSLLWYAVLGMFGRAVRCNPLTGKMESCDIGRRTVQLKQAIEKVLKKKVPREVLRFVLGGRSVRSVDCETIKALIGEYSMMEQWYSAYWREKGIDWDEVDDKNEKTTA